MNDEQNRQDNPIRQDQESATGMGGVEATELSSPEDDPEITEEEKSRQKLLEDPKVQVFLTYYYDKSEKETFGNRTKSYMKAFGVEYKSAGTLGSRLLKKVGKTATDIMEESGIGLPALIALNGAKAVTTDNPRYLDMLYEIGGYKQVPGAMVQQNNQFNIMNVKTEDANDFKNKFKSFLDSL